MANKNPVRQWEKGQSGNPNGRPIKDDTFKAIYDRISSQLEQKRVNKDGELEQISDKEKNVRTLIEIRDNTEHNPIVRMKAMELLLKYTEKVPQTEVQVSGSVSTENLSSEERLDMFDKLVNK